VKIDCSLGQMHLHAIWADVWPRATQVNNSISRSFRFTSFIVIVPAYSSLTGQLAKVENWPSRRRFCPSALLGL
jgi:hypothetical protein